MKRKIPSTYTQLLCAFLLGIFLFSCSSDDSSPPDMVDDDPIGMEDDDPDPDPDPMISDTPVARINSGGEAVSFGDDQFTADNFFSAETTAFVNEEIADILDTDRDTLYVTERIPGESRGSFSYNIPISNGMYRVDLHFAEIFWGVPGTAGEDGGAGSRIFDVDIEGVNQLNNYDIFAEVGAVTAVIKSFEIEVTDEELTIELSANEDQPKLSAIEIFGDGELLSVVDD